MAYARLGNLPETLNHCSHGTKSQPPKVLTLRNLQPKQHGYATEPEWQDGWETLHLTKARCRPFFYGSLPDSGVLLDLQSTTSRSCQKPFKKKGPRSRASPTHILIPGRCRLSSSMFPQCRRLDVVVIQLFN